MIDSRLPDPYWVLDVGLGSVKAGRRQAKLTTSVDDLKTDFAAHGSVGDGYANDLPESYWRRAETDVGHIERAVGSECHRSRQEQARRNDLRVSPTGNSHDVASAGSREGMAGRIFQHIHASLMIEGDAKHSRQAPNYCFDMSGGIDL